MPKKIISKNSKQSVKPLLFFLVVLAIGYYALTKFQVKNTVLYVGNNETDLIYTPTCQASTPYSFRVTVPCGDQMYRRASYRCNKAGLNLGTDTQNLGDSKSCHTIIDWYSIVQDQCGGMSCPPVVTPTSTPSPIPPIQRSCPPTPRCQPWQEMMTGDPMGGVGCPSFKCIDKAD